MRILLTCTDIKKQGGVANYFLVIRKHFRLQVDYLKIGSPPNSEHLASRVLRLLRDYINLIKTIKSKQYNYDIVHLNPSLNFKAVVRDGLSILISVFYGKKVIIFFHGWCKKFEQSLNNSLLLWLFKWVYGKSDAFIVLANDFKHRLISWGFQQPIYLETTLVDDSLIHNFNIHKKLARYPAQPELFLLFLARVEKSKGIYETIDSIQILGAQFDNVELIVAGDGSELNLVKDYVKQKSLSNIHFTGFVEGNNKRKIFLKSDIYCLLSHGEGMPTSVLEAMAFGLPVITRPVGGLMDFFEHGKHGIITESNDPKEIARLIGSLILDRHLITTISKYNHAYAKKKFLASQGVKRLENIYTAVIGKQS